MDLSTILARRADFTPDKPAIVFEEQSVSYTVFCTRIAQTAGALTSLGVTAGDRVAVLAQNHPAILELLFACARLGLCSLSRVYLATQWAKCRNSNFEKSSQRSN